MALEYDTFTRLFAEGIIRNTYARSAGTWEPVLNHYTKAAGAWSTGVPYARKNNDWYRMRSIKIVLKNQYSFSDSSGNRRNDYWVGYIPTTWEGATVKAAYFTYLTWNYSKSTSTGPNVDELFVNVGGTIEDKYNGTGTTGDAPSGGTLVWHKLEDPLPVSGFDSVNNVTAGFGGSLTPGDLVYNYFQFNGSVFDATRDVDWIVTVDMHLNLVLE